MSNEIRNTDKEVRHLCSCGLPGFVDVDNPDKLLQGSSFGRFPCKRHYQEFLEQKQRDLKEYLTCFTSRSTLPAGGGWPSEYQVQKAQLEAKVKNETVT